MKTYSVAMQSQTGIWFTNIGQFNSLEDIDWNKVEEQALRHNDLAYGYYYGHKSNTLTASRCRTIIKSLPGVIP